MLESFVVGRLFLWVLIAIFVYVAVSMPAEYLDLVSIRSSISSEGLSSVRGNNSKHDNSNDNKLVDCTDLRVGESFDCAHHGSQSRQGGEQLDDESGDPTMVDETAVDSATSDLEISGKIEIGPSIVAGEEIESIVPTDATDASEDLVADKAEEQTHDVSGNNEASDDAAASDSVLENKVQNDSGTTGVNFDEAPTDTEQRRDEDFKQITPRQGRWIPVTEKEKNQVEDINACTHQFHHCCVGQCRQLQFVHEHTPNLYKKWSEPLPGLLDVFRYMDSKGMPCHLSFVGDSLSHDHAVAGMCELSRTLGDEYGLLSCKPINGNRSEWGEFHSSCPERSHQFTHYEFTRRNDSSTSVGLSCDSIMVSFSPFKLPNLDRVNEGTNRTGGVMVWNWGVHCHKKTDGCLEENMDEVMIPTLGNPSFANWKMLWREHEPQHFATVGGTYEGEDLGSSSSFECRPASNPDNWRNIGMGQLFRDRNLTIPVVPLFDALSGAYDWHMTGRDCTHYCYTPWRFQLSWDGILRVLRSMLGDTDIEASATSTRH